jgi:YD repeat-containing protein
MNISYDQAVDALYISFRQAPVDNTDEVHENINFDYDADGHVVGIEVLDASRLISDPAEATLEVHPAT